MIKEFQICEKCKDSINLNDRFVVPDDQKRHPTCHACNTYEIPTTAVSIRVEGVGFTGIYNWYRVINTEEQDHQR